MKRVVMNKMKTVATPTWSYSNDYAYIILNDRKPGANVAYAWNKPIPSNMHFNFNTANLGCVLTFSHSDYPSSAAINAVMADKFLTYETATPRRCLPCTLRLPPEYQEVDYLESTGTQSINTGIVLDDSCKLAVKFYPTQNKGQAFFGTTYAVGSWILATDQNGATYWFGKPYVTLPSISSGVLYDITADSSGITYNGAFYGAVSNSNYTLKIFGIDGSNRSSERIYRVSVDRNGRILELIPCYRKSDNKPGMFDLVTRQFFTNQGTGEFLVGNAVNTGSRRIIETKAKQVDLGTLVWYADERFSVRQFYAALDIVRGAIKTVSNPTYTETNVGWGEKPDKTFGSESGYIIFADSSYSTPGDFKQAMQGVILTYETQ